MSVTIRVSKSASTKRLHGARKNLCHLVVQYVVLAWLWPEEYPASKCSLIQIISRDGSPFSMDLFRKVYDVLSPSKAISGP